MSRARRRSRAPGGRTERRSRRGHHPARRAGKVRADAPRDTRRGGLPHLRDSSHAPAKRGVRGCRGCRGGTPLTPCPAPGRRPAARSGQQPQAREEEKNRERKPLPSHPMPRAGQATRRPHRAAAAGQGRGEKQRKKAPSPLTPCPRRAGDLPPAPGSSRRPGKRKKTSRFPFPPVP